MDRIDSLLARRQRLHRIKTTAMLIVGIPLSFFGPAVLATIFWMALIFGSRSFRQDYPIGWVGLFVILSIVVVPLLYRLERRTGGGYFAQAFGESEVRAPQGTMFVPGIARDFMVAGALLGNPRATSSLFVEFFLFGPRMALGGYCQARLARRIRLPHLAPAAGVLKVLLRAHTGMGTSSLPGFLNKEEALPVLAYLGFYQWIGISQDWDRVWLFSESRRTLGQPG